MCFPFISYKPIFTNSRNSGEPEPYFRIIFKTSSWEPSGRRLRTSFRYWHHCLGWQLTETQTPQYFMDPLQQGDVECEGILAFQATLQDSNSVSLCYGCHQRVMCCAFLHALEVQVHNFQILRVLGSKNSFMPISYIRIYIFYCFRKRLPLGSFLRTGASTSLSWSATSTGEKIQRGGEIFIFLMSLYNIQQRTSSKLCICLGAWGLSRRAYIFAFAQGTL